MTDRDFTIACQVNIDRAMDQARAEHPNGDTETVLVEAVRILAVKLTAAEDEVSAGFVRERLRIGSGGVG